MPTASLLRSSRDDWITRSLRPLALRDISQQDGGELSGNVLSILLLAMGYLRPNNRLIGSAGSSGNA